MSKDAQITVNCLARVAVVMAFDKHTSNAAKKGPKIVSSVDLCVSVCPLVNPGVIRASVKDIRVSYGVQTPMQRSLIDGVKNYRLSLKEQVVTM